MSFWRYVTGGAALVVTAALPATAGEPVPWQMGMQAAATPIKSQVTAFHDLMLIIITGVCLLVLALLIFVALRFRAATNAQASRTTHNTLLEVAWTAVPVLILVIIAMP
jgi:cytochrome c oxidase subunit 2